MPLFFFDFSGDRIDATDDLGCTFASVEDAFLDAHRCMVEVGAEMLLNHENPCRLQVGIRAEGGETLMVLTYDEVLRRPGARERPRADIDRPLHDRRASLLLQMESSRQLSAEVACAFENVKATLANTRLMLGRAKVQTEAAQRLGW